MNELLDWLQEHQELEELDARGYSQSRMAVDRRVATEKAQVYKSVKFKIAQLIEEGKIS